MIWAEAYAAGFSDAKNGSNYDARRSNSHKERPVIPAEAMEAAHMAWREQAALDGSIFEYNLRAALEAAVVHVQRPTVTEWGAGFPTHPYPYNYHQSRDEAQKYVDGMKEVGVNMAVMTREVIPAEATAWKPADSHTSIGASQ